MISQSPVRFERRIVIFLATMLLPAVASAGIFRLDNLFGSDSLGEIQGIYDIEVAYGARYRLNDQDPSIIAVTSGGNNAANSLLDDGNLNYDKNDLVSNMVRTTGELTLRLGQFGAFVRGYAFYDYENDQNDRARTPLSASADE